MADKSDTPLTDINRGYVTDDPPTLTKHISGLFVPANFAGGLERALNDTRRELAASERQNFDHKSAIGALEKELARYQQAKLPKEPQVYVDIPNLGLQTESLDSPEWADRLVAKDAYDTLARAYAALKVGHDELDDIYIEIQKAVEGHGYVHMANGKGIGSLLDELDELKAKLAACEKETQDKTLNVCADLADHMLRDVAGGENVGKAIRALKENKHE